MRLQLFIAALFLLFSASLSRASSEQVILRDVTVLADPSLTIALNHIASAFSEEMLIPVATSYASSKQHLKYIRDGNPAHVFIGAKESWIKTIQQEGLMDIYSRRTIVRNRLAFVAPLPAIDAPKSLEEMVTRIGAHDADIMFALGDPEYLAEGTYTLEAIRSLNIGATIAPRYAFFKDGFTLKKAINKYDAFGAVLYTDALLYPDLVLIEAVNPSHYQPITYQAVVLLGDNMENARKFTLFMQSEKAQAIFKRYGFLVAE